MKKHFWITNLALACVFSPLASAEPLLTHVDVFNSGTDGYYLFRIPAIETTPDGSLLAFAEARKYGVHDPGYGDQDIDLVYKRSTDGGKTWSSMKILEDPGKLWSAANAATVVDRQTGRVGVLYLRSKPHRSTETARPQTDDMQTIARWSEDNGQTWSKPVDLTNVARDMEDDKWGSSVIGPGGAIQTKSGRLIAPAFLTPAQRVFSVYSDDHGATWQRSSIVPGGKGANESQLVELADGTILMDSRHAGGSHRWTAISSDGGKTWSESRQSIRWAPVACAIERFSLESAGDDKNCIIWTGPRGPDPGDKFTHDRSNLVMRVSYDEAKTFPVERLMYKGFAGYSDLTILKDKTAGVFWERDGEKYLTFTRLNREFFQGETEAELKSPLLPQEK